MDSFFGSVMMFSMVLRFFLDPPNLPGFSCSNRGLPSPKNDLSCGTSTVKFANQKGHEENHNS